MLAATAAPLALPSFDLTSTAPAPLRRRGLPLLEAVPSDNAPSPGPRRVGEIMPEVLARYGLRLPAPRPR